ncbi:MAG: hypothetical protein EA401_03895 [Planctomycetota bacterium]|nr:MAG: hypothetical protein EA401_03895 [Planctomycetota bacterium]
MSLTYTPSRKAFTLAEIAFSLAIVALGVVTIFLMIPEGIRTQSEVRYKVIAAAKAQEIINHLRQHAPGMAFDARNQDKEGVFPWDTATTYKSMAPDLESMLENQRGNIKPLPERIARRLESENDEIRGILNNGGRLYYFYPGVPGQAVEGVRSSPMDLNWIDGSRKLVFAVIGASQHNSILYHPSVKIGPYQDFIPSPPSHGRQSVMRSNYYDSDFFHPNRRVWTEAVCYDALARDPDIAPVFAAFMDFSNAVGTSASAATATLSAETSREYFQAARRYAEEVGFTFGDGSDEDILLLGLSFPLHEMASRPLADRPPETWPPNGFILPEDDPREYGLDPESLDLDPEVEDEEIWEAFFAAWPPRYSDFLDTHSAPDHWRQVLAMRYLAHAAMTFTSHHRDDLSGDDPPGVGIEVERLDEDDEPITVTYAIHLSHIRAWSEAALQLAVRHSDKAGPYHWATPRPLNRQVMMDHPLVQLDLLSPVIQRQVAFVDNHGSGATRYPRGYSSSAGTSFPPLVHNNTVLRQQWRALYPQRIRTPGLSDRPWMYPGRVLDVNGDGYIDHNDRNIPAPGNPHADAAVGHASHFNLTAPFAPQERIRELVFWAVDWMSYVDAESAPSAAVDASRYPIPAPAPNHSAPQSDPMTWSNPFLSHSDYRRQLNGLLGISSMANNRRNPELAFLFLAPSRQWDPDSQDFSRDFSSDWYSNTNVTSSGPMHDRIPIMSEINTWIDPNGLGHFGLSVGSISDNLWDSPLARMLDMRSASTQNMPASVQDAYYGHNPEWLNMMIFLGRYGANRSGQNEAEWINWRESFGESTGTARKQAATLHRGIIPASVRLRASTVARFTFYDPRLSGGLHR